MVQFQRHYLIDSSQYIGKVAEYLSTNCYVIRQDPGMGDIPVAWHAVNCGDEWFLDRTGMAVLQR
jgi:hypothetical protein